MQEKPHAEKWKKMQIKHYDTLKELFGADRATDVNMGHDTPTFSANLDSPNAPHSQPNQLGGTSTSRETKRKSPMNDFLEAQYEKVALGITTMADAVKEARIQCYQFLCENEQKKRQIFGIPLEMRLDALFHFMTAAGVRLGDMVLP
ncbi:hypothetical protein Ahy_B09g095404 [Arachis hypogaea]|uniref:Uncharacterized protein n=1 Tax=Arachis hypogaea TaxID=3818 RepID=A0A444XEH2_ARAHY|nr:hypothetical protein Ahy_B09g095404 [Arachis hypogaea]